MNWSLISDHLRIAKKDKATYATLYSNGGSRSRVTNTKSSNGSSSATRQYDLYVRKEVECQRRFTKLMTDIVHSMSSSSTAEGGGSGRKRAAAAGSGGDKREMSKGPWTEEEDRKVVELVGKYGPKKWSQIALELPGAGEFVMFSSVLLVAIFITHINNICLMYMQCVFCHDYRSHWKTMS